MNAVRSISAYCAVACPYQARYKTLRATFAYGAPMEHETARQDDARLAVATKCTFCVDRIDSGLRSEEHTSELQSH